MTKIRNQIVAAACGIFVTSGAVLADTQYVDGFLNEIEKGLSASSPNLSSAKFYVDQDLLPIDFDWESVLVAASHAPANPFVSVGPPTEERFFKRAPEVYALLSQIRTLDLSRTDLLCLDRSRGRPGAASEAHIPLTSAALDAFPKSCSLLEVSYKGLVRADYMKWLASVGVDLNHPGRFENTSGLAAMITMTSILQNELIASPEQAHKAVSHLAGEIDFNIKYSQQFWSQISRGVQTVTKSKSYDFSDFLTSVMDFSGDARLLSAYCKIAAENTLAEYSPNFSALAYFLEYDQGFARSISLGRNIVSGTPCYNLVETLLERPGEREAFRDAALRTGNITVFQSLDAMFSGEAESGQGEVSRLAASNDAVGRLLSVLEGGASGTMLYHGNTFIMRAERKGENIEVHYPTYSCGGVWKLASHTATEIEFVEQITYGTGNCPTAFVNLSEGSNGQVKVRWYSNRSGPVEGEALLSRSP